MTPEEHARLSLWSKILDALAKAYRRGGTTLQQRDAEKARADFLDKECRRIRLERDAALRDCAAMQEKTDILKDVIEKGGLLSAEQLSAY